MKTSEAQKRASEKYRLKHMEYYSQKSKEYQARIRQERNEYKQRIEDAIKYINEEKRLSMFNDCSEPEEDWSYDLECDANDLLNILEGKNGDK